MRISKIYTAIAASVIALAMSGCAKVGDIDSATEVELTITASFAEDKTKTTLQDGSTSVYWEAGDEICVFLDGEKGRFISTNYNNVTETKFKGSITAVMGGEEGYFSGNSLLGLYPYRSDAECDGTSITTVLPAEQMGRAGSFAKNTNIAVSTSDNTSLAFYNVCGGIRFTLCAEGVKTVTLKGNDDEDLAGRFCVTFENSQPVIKEVTDGLKSIVLNAPDQGTFQTGKWYYIAALPETLSQGCTLEFRTDSLLAVLKTDSQVKFTRGVYLSKSEIDAGLTWQKASAPSSSYIQFADPNVKTACVNKYDLNGDGELSYTEAAAVQSINGLFEEYRYIESFDEFQYFTSVTSIPGRCFARMSILKSITLPESINYIGSYAFYSCTSLESFHLPANVYGIYTRAFEDCKSMKSFTFEKGSKLRDLSSSDYTTYDGGSNSNYIGIFSGCTSLTEITLPASVTSLGCRCFYNCTSLKKVALEDESKLCRLNCSDWNGTGGPFVNCTSLEEVELTDAITELGIGTFQGCSSLICIKGDWEENITSIGSSAFSGCESLSGTINLLKCKSIGGYAFSRCKSIENVILSDNCTTVGGGAFYCCSNLNSIKLSKAQTIINGSTFSGCSSLSSIELPKFLAEISGSAFSGCSSLKTVAIPENVMTIGNYAFSGTGLTAVSLPNSVKSLGNSVFSQCKDLEQASLPSSITAIPSALFSGCTSLYDILIPESVSSIGTSAFENCKFVNPSSSYSRISVPESINKIGNYALNGVKEIKLLSPTIVSIENSSFSQTARIYVPDSMVDEYESADVWSSKAGQIFPMSSFQDIPAPEAIDLGLSVKWATCNVGAEFCEDYGGYFAWGETETKETYDWGTYKWCKGSDNALTKYCPSDKTDYWYNFESGVNEPDNLLKLEDADDVAHTKWGGNWRMPSDAEWTELRENCTWTWASCCGVKGYLVTSNIEGYTDRTIFLPAAGYFSGSYFYSAGSNGCFWSSSINEEQPNTVLSISFYSSGVGRAGGYRSSGRSVRPVCDK